LTKDLLKQKLSSALFIVSDDAGAVRSVVSIELGQAKKQCCVMHFERNILAKVSRREVHAVLTD
jgi:transposase-like protein